jgi:ABC-2 type transport system permease protein
VRYAILAVAAGFIALRVWQRFYRRRARRARHARDALETPETPDTRTEPRWPRLQSAGGVAGLVAGREVRERLRSRVFKIGTVIVLLVVAAAVLIPQIRKGSHPQARVGVVGALSGPLQATVIAAGKAVGVTVTLVPEESLATAESDLTAGKVALVIVEAQRLVVKQAISATDTSRSALLVRAIASAVSLQANLEAAGIPPERAATLAHPPPLPVTSLQPAKHNGTARVTAVYGLILMYVLLTQYGTWIMMGVVEEKSSRVVEVLLSTMRTSQLLMGKVVGIGVLALAQGALIVAVALGLGEAVGSDLIKGAGVVQVLSILLWMFLGYAFYCWVYAAGGSLADRQEHIQTLALPLQLPILFGYIVSLTSIGSSTPSTLVRILAYLPPTAPFAMPVLVADNAVTWWGYTLSVLLTVAATVAVARLASTIYSRAILRTGRRLRVREAFARS